MARRRRTAAAIKRLMDIAGSTAGMVATGPVMVGAAAAIRVTMGSPVLFRQQRPGKDGELFELVKFRTMRAPGPGEDDVRADGMRLTRLGALLRSSSVDELPTLWNVLVGDMSLVGPRPLLTQYLGRYTAEQARRHDVKPGITGWAQIHGRNALSWKEKFDLDVWYVDHWSLALDLACLTRTVGKVVLREGISAPGAATMEEFMGNEEEDSA